MEQITYEENILLKAIELAKIRFGASWDLLNESARQVEIVMATPQAERAMEWASEIAHAVNGPQFSKKAIDSMLEILGVIPADSLKPKKETDGN